MGLALDTVLVDVHNATTAAIGLTNGTVTNSGDQLAIRSFDSPAWATLMAAWLQGSGTRNMRILSPRLHDNVSGLTWVSAESPSEFLLPPEIGQRLYSVDQLTVQLDAAASSDTVAALLVYYKDLQGINADLRTWDQIKGRVLNIKSMEVDVTSSGTIGAWSDTVITTTDNQLKADYKYAVLGFESNSALIAMGIKGPCTGNLRACVPGATATFPLTDYNILMGQRHGVPMIPVFKANDRGNTLISVAANTASVSAKVFAILAQLEQD